ncbi:hypothetical protein EGM51_04155 [Verrucomicrobia bacterium S94]|nr:hypothetical protein EGM51_04155 [Verrucomicrobia bacterium S94]
MEPEDYLTGEFILNKPGKYKVQLVYASQAAKDGSTLSEHTGAVFDPKANTTVGGRFALTLGDNTMQLTIEDVKNKERPSIFMQAMLNFQLPEKKQFAL